MFVLFSTLCVVMMFSIERVLFFTLCICVLLSLVGLVLLLKEKGRESGDSWKKPPF
jgi:hypothetical protein